MDKHEQEIQPVYRTGYYFEKNVDCNAEAILIPAYVCYHQGLSMGWWGLSSADLSADD